MATQTKVHIKNLELRRAKIVEHIEAVHKGSVINELDEFKDAVEIINSVKKEGAVPYEMWMVFDKEAICKRHPELKKMRTLIPAFADKVRKFIEKQGVEKHISLEQRKDKFYLVGNE